MSDFLNRIDLQRKVIKIVNKSVYKFQISGLSIMSIKKWKEENRINNDNDIFQLLILISSKLFFLSNKSQEQITEEYKNLTLEVSGFVNQLELLIKKRYC
ncbi:hypothetical protein EZS27_016774 [termite gut metagenome]|uniref:Four helix bundle protein n=1 Tax=termite gut metagenome TaxID=433724 RepID=A0A5J4RLI2_9ZZZZ